MKLEATAGKINDITKRFDRKTIWFNQPTWVRVASFNRNYGVSGRITFRINYSHILNRVVTGVFVGYRDFLNFKPDNIDSFNRVQKYRYVGDSTNPDNIFIDFLIVPIQDDNIEISVELYSIDNATASIAVTDESANGSTLIYDLNIRSSATRHATDKPVWYRVLSFYPNLASFGRLTIQFDWRWSREGVFSTLFKTNWSDPELITQYKDVRVPKIRIVRSPTNATAIAYMDVLISKIYNQESFQINTDLFCDYMTCAFSGNVDANIPEGYSVYEYDIT